jgi:hypothetical protein
MHSRRKAIYKSNLKAWARGETKNHCVRGTVFYENITTKRLKVFNLYVLLGVSKKIPSPRSLQWLGDNGFPYVFRERDSFDRLLGFEIYTAALYSSKSNEIAEAFVKTFKGNYIAFGNLSSPQKATEQLILEATV